jgi:5-bromo-4-chloroindolyl phosphate hydrolysis protein
VLEQVKRLTIEEQLLLLEELAKMIRRNMLDAFKQERERLQKELWPSVDVAEEGNS